ncbi:RecQ family zinc-binding domain-containing protein [Blastococcus sp. SYSU DS0510]
MVRGYAETTGCRRQFLLGCFGEQLPHPCGNCDTCAAGTAEDHAVGDAPFPVAAPRVGARRGHVRGARPADRPVRP